MQIYPLRLFNNKTNINFIKWKKASYIISTTLALLSIVLVFTIKLNFGIDFIGGITMNIRSDKNIDLGEVREVINKLDVGEVVIQNLNTDKDIALRIGASKDNAQVVVKMIQDTLLNKFKQDFEYRKVDFVGPQVGREMLLSGLQALILAFIAIMIYIWIRFEWQFGIGVIVTLLHDAILSLGFMSITKLDFNLSSVAAILTVIGYSVNDSVVIYDRVRENIRKRKKDPLGNVINTSINETLSRTTLTVVTTLIANLMLIIFGGEAIKSFSILVFFGILVGTYSSIFIAAPILTLFKGKLKSIKS